jgi:hypothetical protein
MSWCPDRGLLGAALVAGMLAAAVAPPATAADGTDACTGTISALPAVVSTPGTWCLDRHLSTAITSGAAITINVDDVVIDCNRYRLRGTGGSGTLAHGIEATHRQRLTVRRCRIDGFAIGLMLTGLGGRAVIVEDNVLWANTQRGMFVIGDGSIIRRNRVLDTGGGTAGGNLAAYGISAIGDIDVLDNVVDGVRATVSGGQAYGISTSDSSGVVARNQVRGLASEPGSSVLGIYSTTHQRAVIRGNRVDGDGGAHASSQGIGCPGGIALAKDNVVTGFALPVNACLDGGGNVVSP